MVMVTMNYAKTSASEDTPIVCIAGSTLSEITTTTTSTKTTPTPVPTSNDANNSKNLNKTKDIFDDNVESETLFNALSKTAESVSPLKSSAILLKLMSDNKFSTTEADNNILELHNFNNPASPAASVYKTTRSCPIKSNKKIVDHNVVKSTATTTVITDVSIKTAESDLNVDKSLKSKPTLVVNSACTANTKKSTSKESLSGSWEECRLKDWDDNQLKELLEEAYNYKNPRDKENKSKAFLQLLEKAENEDASYPFGTITPRSLSNSIASNIYHNYRKANAYHHITYNSHNNSQYNNNYYNNNNSRIKSSNDNNSHHRSHHRTHKQGGSLQDLFNEAQLDCDHTFSSASSNTVVGGNQKGRRQNHNSRQKKYSSSVSSRQREGGSLPGNVNVTYQLNSGTAATATTTATTTGSINGNGARVADNSHINTPDFTFFHDLTESIKPLKKEQRCLNKSNNNTTNNNSTNGDNVENNQVLLSVNQGDTNTFTRIQMCPKNSDNRTTESRYMNSVKTIRNTETIPNSTITNTRDCIIEIGEPVMDVQQEQQLLFAKGQDAGTQGVLPTYYENLVNLDGQIPRVNFVKTKCNSFAPTTYHCYVDESIRFSSLESVGEGSGNIGCNGINNVRIAGKKGQKNNSIGDDTVLSAAHVTISTAAAITKSAPMMNTTKYLPLDDTYKSCISVLGNDVGDTISDKLCLKPKCITTYPKTLLPSIQPVVASCSTLTGITVQQQYHQSRPHQQQMLDENGNALSEFYQSVANISSTTIHLGIPPPVALGNVPTSSTVTISAAPNTTSSSVSASTSIANALNCNNSSGGSVGIGVSVCGNSNGAGISQIKGKSKKKSLQERNTKTVDVESVAGYRGNDTVEELVKYIESGESGSNISKAPDKKKDRRKDKEKHQKFKKSNSLEELRSGAKLDLQDMKRSATTTETNAVIMRHKQGNKQNKNSSSTADIHKSSDNNKHQNNNNSINNNINSHQSTTINTNSVNVGSCKSDSPSWGNDELKCLEHQQQHVNEKAMELKTATEFSNNITATINNASTAITTRDRQKFKSNVKQSYEKDRERDYKDMAKDKTKECIETNLITIHNVSFQEQHQKQQTNISTENNEQMSSGKLGKVETRVLDGKSDLRDKIDKRKKDVLPNTATIGDILSMESVLPETAEFHVVTKRKKPKKQKFLNNSEENTLMRSQNISMSKVIPVATGNNNNQGHNSVRYKHQPNEIQQSCQTVASIQESRCNTERGDGRSGRARRNLNGNNNSKDKLRRKSTSSMPPSEKLDISDQDSVHSLPIESVVNVTRATTISRAAVPLATCPLVVTPKRSSEITVPEPLAIAVMKRTQNKSNKSLKHQQQFTTSITNSTIVSKTIPTAPLAPISYADIARNKDININDNQTEIILNVRDITPQHNSNGALNISGNICANRTSNANATFTIGEKLKMQTTISSNVNGKIHKMKKSQKVDFPELRNNSNTVQSTIDALPLSHSIDVRKSAQKSIVHPPCFSANVVSTSNRLNEYDCTNDYNIIQSSRATIAVNNNIYNEVQTMDVNKASHYAQQQQHVQQQHNVQMQHAQNTHIQNVSVLHKSKSVEHDSSNPPSTHNNNTVTTVVSSTFNINKSNFVTSCHITNLDQQYPTLEKTVKRYNNNTSNNNSNNNNVVAAVTLALNSTNYVPTQSCAATTNKNNLSQYSSDTLFLNVGAQTNTILTNTSISQSTQMNGSAFNFSTATKRQQQQIITIKGNESSSDDHLNVKQMIQTTSNSLKDNANTNGNGSSNNNNTITNNKKYKETSPLKDNSTTDSLSSLTLPTLLSTPTSVTVACDNNTSPTSNIMYQSTNKQASVVAMGLPAQIQILRRSKKERQQQQLMYNAISNNNRKLIGNNNNSNSNNINNNNDDNNNNNTYCNNNGNISNSQQYSTNTLTVSQLSTSIDLPINECGNSTKGGNNGNSDKDQLPIPTGPIYNKVNRPAVIILNDDSNRRANKDLVFGDLAEDVRELLFQDINSTKEENMPNMIPTNCDNSKIQSLPSNVVSTYCQDKSLGEISGSMEIKLNNASPKTSVYTTHHPYISPSVQNSSVTAVNGQSYAQYVHNIGEDVKMRIETPTININCIPSSNVKERTNFSNSVESMTEISLPQQLETCNEIETVIIAAARAEQHYQEQKQPQIQYKNSKSSSNSSSFSSLSIAAISTTATSNTTSNNYGNSQACNPANTYSSHTTNLHYSQRRHSLSGHNKRAGYPQMLQCMHQQQSPQFYDEDISVVSITSTSGAECDSRTTNLRTSVHGTGRICCIFISQTNGPYKEVHFVQSPARPLTYNQHRRHGQLVDFISSSWDDILNSNGTRMYVDNINQ